MAVRLSLCGDLTVTRDGVELTGPRLGTRKARVFLAALASASGTTVSVDRLVEAVWPEHGPRDPQANLATFASRLRKAAGEDLIEPGPSSYGLGRQVELDLDVADTLNATAAARLARGEPTLALAGASRALEVLGEDASLAEECDGAWADGVRRRSVELRRDARHLTAVAATALGQADLARSSASAASAADPFDERAHRDLMAALAADGRTSAALDAYTALAARLGDELGTDPDPETRQLHLALLRGDPLSPPGTAPEAARPGSLVGREDELVALDRAWTEAAAGSPSLVVVAGVPGIGKTSLLAEAARLARASGGLVLTTRCRPGERSLFLQPFVEVLRPLLLSRPAPALRSLLGVHLPAWARLLPELVELFDVAPEPELALELARRRSYDAVVAVVVGLAACQPVLFSVDDLQYGADATADLVAHLSAQAGRSPILVLAASRTDGLPRLRKVVEGRPPLLLGPIPASAVEALAAAAGFASRADEVRDRTRGHPLSVVASLRSLASGTEGVPRDLSGAVAGQVGLLDDDSARLVAAASVLGPRVDPALLARLADRPEVDVVLICEQLVTAGLLTPAGADYEFTNDLVQESVLASVPAALAVALNRRAADLLAERPERMAHHAHRAGELRRAAGGYLEAGRMARRTAALDDALALLDQALDDAQEAGSEQLAATILLERARAHEARTDFAAAESDVRSARATLGGAPDPRLEMRSLRHLGGDVAIARRRPLTEVIEHNRAGLGLAAELGDAVAEAVFRSRIAVLEATRLHLRSALELSRSGVADARATGSEEAVARSLDGLKTALAYCGDAAGLQPLLDELIPLLTRLRLPWLLQWSLLESSAVPAAAGRWAEARARVDEALEVNRATGYGAYAGYFRAERGWLARWAGDLDAAQQDGRESVAETSPADHPWWYATAVGTYASTLLEVGRPDEAAELCRAGLDVLGPEGGAAYQLRCLAPLAAATGEGMQDADALLSAVEAPAGGAWVAGADVYLTLAAAWRAAGDEDRARATCAPLLAATGPRRWATIHRAVRQRSSPTR